MAIPAEAKKRQAKPAEQPIADPANGEPMTLVVSLNNQRVEIFRGTQFVTSSKVSTGMRGYATKAGVFSILEKKRMHHSNLYSGAPMPYMQRLTWSGTALHAGIVPGYPASHGCIRLPFSFAPKLFGITTVGENVVVAKDSVAPRIIEHANLFQPLPPPEAPAMVKQDHPPQRQSSLEIDPAKPKTMTPVIFVEAGVGGITIDRTPAIAFEATPAQPRMRVATASSQVKAAGMVPTGEAAADSTDMDAQVEDTHSHAIDPFAGGPAQASKQGRAPGHALDEEDDNAPSTDVAIERAPAPKPETAAVEVETPKAEKPVAQAAKPAPVLPVVAEISPAPPSAPVEAKAEVAVPTPAPVPAAQAPATPAPAGAVAEAKPEAAASAVAEATPAVPAVVTNEPALEPAVSLAQPGLAPEADAPHSLIASKLGAGTKAAGLVAAEPRSTAPLRILVTRRNQKDRIVGLQRVLADMGYIEEQEFDGTIGKSSVAGIKTFQRNNGVPETGAISEELISKVYEVAGKGQPPVGHLFVRQEFAKLFDAPVNFRDPETPLGTHLFTAMKFEPGATKTRWMSVSLKGDDPAAALDRIEIPNDIRQMISERLTPGSSFIIGDLAINSGGLPKGGDFVVWAKDTPAKITAASLDGDISQPRAKKKKKRSVRRPNYNYGFSPPRNYTRGYGWPF
jgi:peptidoglycan hydrolase-like protein with peptidoglycan-binding domain